MFKITKEFHFSASHQLIGLPEDHPCSRVHGHNYVITVELQAVELNQVGFVKDYRALDSIKRYIDDQLDHRHLNDVFHMNPTAEIMAVILFEKFKSEYPELISVSVSETPKTNAKYEPNN